jgi:hypothetical protein
MDPITTAIIAVLPALASELVKSSVKDAYECLKAVIGRKFGKSSSIAKAVEALEANPKSKGQAAVLAENVAAANATSDRDVMKALTELVDQLNSEGLGGSVISQIKVNITGGTVEGVVGAGNVSIMSLNFGTLPKDAES